MKFLELYPKSLGGDNLYFLKERQTYAIVSDEVKRKIQLKDVFFGALIAVPVFGVVFFLLFSKGPRFYEMPVATWIYALAIAVSIGVAELFLWNRQKMLTAVFEKNLDMKTPPRPLAEVLILTKKSHRGQWIEVFSNTFIIGFLLFLGVYMVLPSFTYTLWVNIRKMDFFGYRDFMKNQLEKLPEAERAVI